MEEIREQPVITPAPALNVANDEEQECVVGEIGSQNSTLGKFKSVQALMDAYNSLQSEFTKKCQLISDLQKDKIESSSQISVPTQNEQQNDEEAMGQFLSQNREAGEYAQEIQSKIDEGISQNTSPYEVAWAKVLLSHLKEGDEKSEPIINQYVLSNENVKNKIIENYLKELSNSKPPMVISSQGGERVSGVVPDAPKTLHDAKKLVDKMFS